MYLKELYINKEAWYDVNRHAVEGGLNEIGGFMTWITKSVRGICTSSPAHVIIETSTYDRVLTVMETEGLSILGWYHTHPKLGIFLSGTDRDTMSLQFNDPFSIALVVDPIRDTWGFFGWDEERKRLKHLNTYLFDGPNYRHYLL
jgi:proteasome lid subunit RPN8/RPN11